MKNLTLLLMLALILAACAGRQGEMSADASALYDELDREILNSDRYEQAKLVRIAELRHQAEAARSPEVRDGLTRRLISEYESYNADSALYYIDRALYRAYRVRDSVGIKHLNLLKADVYAHAGLFPDALAIMQGLRASELPDSLVSDYYAAYSLIYQYLCEFADGSPRSVDYARKRELYADSLRRSAPPGSFSYAVYCLPDQARAGHWEEAVDELRAALKRYESGDRHYSILASILADICKSHGLKEDYRRYITQSAISDVRGVIKENMSFREAAACAFADGDVERANRYIKKSFEDANFYSARMRKEQSSKILPEIDTAYNSMQKKLHRQQRVFIVAVSVLALVLGVCLLFILRQSRRLARTNAAVRAANAELNSLSGQLREANRLLAGRNEHLLDTGRVKEQYAGFFMEACSTALNTLIQYNQSLRMLARQKGPGEALVRKLESSEFMDKSLRDFYNNFDEAIRHIYPTFLESVNALLRPGEELRLRSGEQLSTELRVLALIRIGITDNAKIAQFLRCSVTTVYTYRSKLRKRAVEPENFEDRIRGIDDLEA